MGDIKEDIKILKDTLNRMKRNHFIIQYKDLYISSDVIKTTESVLKRLEQDERVIEEMAKYMATELHEYQLDDIYAELNNCCGMERNWCRGEEKEKIDILTYFRKKVEE